MEIVVTGGPTYKTPTGNIWTADKYNWGTPELSAPLAQILFGSAPGAKGSYAVNFNQKSQDVLLRVLYVGSAETILATWNTDITAMIGPVDVAFAGITLKRCFIDAQGSVNSDIKKLMAGDGANTIVYAMYAIIKLSSKLEAQS